MISDPRSPQTLGGATVEVEYQYTPDEAAVFDADSRGAGPGCPASVTIIGVYIGAEWVPPSCFSARQIDCWQEEILDGMREW